jgi:hypothetical protein
VFKPFSCPSAAYDRAGVLLFGNGDVGTIALPFGQGEIVICAQWRGLGAYVRIDVESIQTSTPFQAEYEGSIPFTRSNILTASRIRGFSSHVKASSC